MVKILYGIQSDGMGHALRSKPVIEYLISQGHEVKIVSSNKAKIYLSKYFDDIEDIHDVSWSYFNNKISYLMTGLKFVINIERFMRKGVVRIKKIFEQYQPDIVITDFELFTAKVAKVYRRPLISLDNITVLKLFKVPKHIKNYHDYTIAKATVEGFISFVDSYFVTSFFKLPVSSKRYKKKLTVVPPILRECIINAKKKIKYGNHFIVYQTTKPTKTLIDTLHSCKDQKFIYYGANKNKKSKNITFRKFSEDEYVKDFATCKGVITNGGFSMISEAIYLQKPILSKPVNGQFEQFVNARMVDEMGYGKYITKMTHDNVYSFIGHLPLYYSKLQKYEQNGNQELFVKLNKEITKLVNKYSTKKRLLILSPSRINKEFKSSMMKIIEFINNLKNKVLDKNIDKNVKKISELDNLINKIKKITNIKFKKDEKSKKIVKKKVARKNKSSGTKTKAKKLKLKTIM